MDISQFFSWIVQKVNNIERLVQKQGRKIMELPQIIVDAIAEETAVALQRDALLLESQEKQKMAESKIMELEALLAASSLDKAAMQSDIDELKQGQIDQTVLLAAIKGIENTPIASAIVTEVIANPEIDTPPEVVAAPPVTPETIQEPTVVNAAIEALSSAPEDVVPAA